MKVKMKGAILAAAVAGLVVSGHLKAEEKKDAKPTTVKCSGVNSCSGKGSCKSDNNSCKGKNGCKGKGWVETKDEKECTDKGGKIVK